MVPSPSRLGGRWWMLSRVDAVGEMAELQGSRNYLEQDEMPELLTTSQLSGTGLLYPDDTWDLAEQQSTRPASNQADLSQHILGFNPKPPFPMY